MSWNQTLYQQASRYCKSLHKWGKDAWVLLPRESPEPGSATGLRKWRGTRWVQCQNMWQDFAVDTMLLIWRPILLTQGGIPTVIDVEYAIPRWVQLRSINRGECLKGDLVRTSHEMWRNDGLAILNLRSLCGRGYLYLPNHRMMQMDRELCIFTKSALVTFVTTDDAMLLQPCKRSSTWQVLC